MHECAELYNLIILFKRKLPHKKKRVNINEINESTKYNYMKIYCYIEDIMVYIRIDLRNLINYYY